MLDFSRMTNLETWSTLHPAVQAILALAVYTGALLAGLALLLRVVA